MAETNIWWDNEQIKALKKHDSYGWIKKHNSALGGIIPAGATIESSGKIQPINPDTNNYVEGISFYAVPYIQREPEVGDYVIFTNSSEVVASHHGFITKVISKSDESPFRRWILSPTHNPMLAEIKTNRIQNNEIRFYTIDPEFVRVIGWGNPPPIKIEETFIPLFSLIGKQ